MFSPVEQVLSPKSGSTVKRKRKSNSEIFREMGGTGKHYTEWSDP